MDKQLIKVVVLAAGKGTRLQTDDNDAPKVMRLACGKPLLEYVLDALPVTQKEDIIIVVGYGKDQVIKYFDGYEFAEQKEQLGTGHAVMAAKAQLLGFKGAVMVCYGDMPAIKKETYAQLLNTHFEQNNVCTILTGETTLDLAFGRIIRDENGDFVCVVEDRDCTPEQAQITEVNTGVYVFDSVQLLDTLDKLKNDNAQGEYYLTDVPEIMRESGAKIGLLKRNLGDEILGVNTPEQLQQVERILSNS
ncbi:MAG: NTP transferase domain-containing protein [Oscillospiraceae bacterium]|nr:NTP transferase domain-containing protein [Oscillospiraceae bacterium]